MELESILDFTNNSPGWKLLRPRPMDVIEISSYLKAESSPGSNGGTPDVWIRLGLENGAFFGSGDKKIRFAIRLAKSKRNFAPDRMVALPKSNSA